MVKTGKKACFYFGNFTLVEKKFIDIHFKQCYN